MTRRKTDGERIILALRKDGWMRLWLPDGAADIDRIIRRRMAVAWENGWFHKTAGTKLDDNPYRGRSKP